MTPQSPPLEALLGPLDEAALAQEFASARPFPHLAIDGFLEPGFAAELAASYPRYADATRLGLEFRALNETRKVQITELARMPDPVKRLAALLAHPDWLALLARVTGIPALEADASLKGGGMHLMGSGARLDVHVDFNRLREDGRHRRLNILLFLNPRWQEAWGGRLELWNEDVSECARSLVPAFNRCVIFRTSEISYHGVEPVHCPEDEARQSFAGYYYTTAAPADYAGRDHTTRFRARPEERWRGAVLMPLDRLRGRVRKLAARLRRVGRS